MAEPARRGKDLQDLQGMPSGSMLAFGQKQMVPDAPRQTPPVPYQSLRLLLPNNLWRWASDYVRYRIGVKARFRSYTQPERDNGIYPLEGDETSGAGPIRVALAGDWGTGTDEAHLVAQLIERFRPHYAIHLGDVYYVGDPGEVRENFLGIADPTRSFTPCRWPDGSNGTFALNGNHEMYARGRGYFHLMLPALGLRVDGRNRGQVASFFCLENAHWRVIALDTGYHSISLPILENIIHPRCALPGKLVDWLRQTVFSQPDGRGVVLLSHHQYYSAYDDWFTRAAEQLAAFLSRPVLWFWGHEHRLAIYEKHQTAAGIAAFGRCIGHGGMPVDLPPATPVHAECAVEFVDTRPYVNDEALAVGINGFAALTFAGAALTVDYVDVHAHVIFTEAWRADGDGGIERTGGGPVADVQ